MQIESLRIQSYRSWKVDEVSGPEARERLGRLELFAELRAAGCAEALCLKTIGWSRATYFRWQKRYREGGVRALQSRSRRPKRCRSRRWTAADEALVLAKRDERPLWGKRKIGAALRRDVAGFALSDSTIGRILRRAMQRGRIAPAAQAAGRAKPKRRRVFAQHAKRWQYGMRGDKPGQLVQMDHMSVAFPGTTIKSFTAVCPATGYLVAQAYSRATSHNAARFLEHTINTMPFAITAIQVDGGSEFCAAFERACQQHHIDLFVLPPKSPKYNAHVERAHRTLREEFYNQYRLDWNLHTLNHALNAYQQHDCHHRPHGGKRQNFQAPMAYYQSLTEAA